MKHKWDEVKLGDVVTLQRGFDLPIQERKPGVVPIVSSSGVSDCHAEAKVKGPGVVTGRYGTIGEVFYVAEDFWPLNTTLFVVDFKGNDPKFVSYMLRTLDFSSFSDKSSVPGVNRNHLHLAHVRKPPLGEQMAIAQMLGALDDKIELNRRMNETLETMARAIFKSWFVDFDPVRAKTEGRQPFAMDAATAALFPDSFVDSPLGKIPKGWKSLPASEALEVNPLRRLARGAEVPYLDMQNVPTRGHRPQGWIRRPFVSGSRFMNGDTLVARITPCLENGKSAFVDFLREGEIGWGSTEFIVLRPKAKLPPEYGYCLARHDDFRLHLIQNMTGSSGRQRVPTDCLSQYLVAVPPDLVAYRFGEIVGPLFGKAKLNSEESSTLTALRDTLLPKLISGQVRVKRVEDTAKA